MNRIPLISSDPELAVRVSGILAECNSDPPELVSLSDAGAAMDHLNIELPELVFVSFPDPALGAYEVLEAIRSDPWLIHGGIIALCEDDDAVERLEETRGANLVAILSPEGLRRQLPRVLDIIRENRRILFQRAIESSLVHEISGQFRLHNDPLEARCFSNLISNFLFNANRIDAEQRDALNLGLYEMLVNGIEHGNCGITYEEKTEWLKEHPSVAGLIERCCQDPAIGRRRVTFEYTIAPDRSRFTITDQGDGFDWRSAGEVPEGKTLLDLHGRGIFMTRAMTQNLSYNEKGNQVRFEIEYPSDRTSTTPGLLSHLAPRELTAGEVVFRRDDPGDFLYFIVKGRYDVLVEEKTVATLTPDDIFLGEMSFLLNARRSATVRAAGDGTLIEISKRGFVEALKLHPHYALLLSRLLAQRIARANRLYGEALRGMTAAD